MCPITQFSVDFDVGGEGNAGSPTQPPSAINVATTHGASLRSPVLDTSPPISILVNRGGKPFQASEQYSKIVGAKSLSENR